MFVVFEGIDGSGKSTLIREVAAKLTWALGQGIYMVREPGSTTTANAIRNVLLSTNSKNIDPLVGNMLFSAARASVVREVIEPIMRQGGWIMSDRYTPSTIAYGHFGLGTPLMTLAQLNQMSTDPIAVPHHVIYLRVTGKKNIAQVYSRRGKEDERDNESLDFITRVVHGYEAMCNEKLDNDALRVGTTWTAFNAMSPIDQLAEQITQYLLTSQ